jgi:hypothetical protein
MPRGLNKMDYTREQLESALDSGKLFVKMNRGNSQRARRNGKTVTWKTRPGDYRIPFKHGFKGYGQITPQVASDSCFEIQE